MTGPVRIQEQNRTEGRGHWAAATREERGGDGRGDGDSGRGIDSNSDAAAAEEKRGGDGADYVHTRQYRKRQKSESKMLSKWAVEVGPTTVDRTAGGRYDWQDGRLRKRRRESTAGGDGERRLRPRDPGRGDGPPPP